MGKRGKLYFKFAVALALLAFAFFSSPFSASATHLDSYPSSSLVLIAGAERFSGRSLAEDISPLVNESGDGLWASISPGDFVRVSFERPLNGSNDITLVARSRSSSSSSVRVLIPESGEEVAHFSNIGGEGTYKVLLSSLGSRTSSQFDLLVEKAPVEIDLITDPDVTACGTLSASGTHTLTQNISGAGTCKGLKNHAMDCIGCSTNCEREAGE